MAKTLLRNARAIVSCDERDRVYEHCDLLIEDQKILEIAPHISCESAQVIDATGKLIYPGLVNTHHHFFQTFIRNLTTIDYPNMTVLEWLDVFFQAVRYVDSDVMYYSALTAMADLVKHGCTTAFDHQYCFNARTGKASIDRQMEAAQQIGIRYHAGRATNTRPMSDGSPIPDDIREDTEIFIAHTRALIEKYHDASPFSMRQIVIAPCQPMNCAADCFTASVALAKETGCRLHTHLGEGENEFMQARYGMRTLEWCRRLGFLGENVWFAHCWELTPEEYKMIGDYGAGVSHCPAPAILSGFPILPMKQMLRDGVCLSLGCDGSATNDSSNLLDSIRTAYYMQCYFGKERGGAVTAYDILKIATAGGAKTLGRSDLGSLAPGKAADLFLIDGTTLELVGATHDPKNLIGRVGLTGNVAMTMIGGKIVFDGVKLTGIDERRLAVEADRAHESALRSQCPVFQKAGC